MIESPPPVDPAPTPEPAVAPPAPEELSAPLSREIRRSRRKREVRAKTQGIKRMPKRDLQAGRELADAIFEELADLGVDVARPKTRGECARVERPCPFVSCQHHMYLDVSPKTGAIKLNFPDLDVWEMRETCALDVADRGGATLERTGEMLNVTRERVRQMEKRAKARMLAAMSPEQREAFAEALDLGTQRHHLPVVQDDNEEDDSFGNIGQLLTERMRERGWTAGKRAWAGGSGRPLGECARALLDFLDKRGVAHAREISVSCGFATNAGAMQALYAARKRGHVEQVGHGFWRRVGSKAEPTLEQVARWSEKRAKPKSQAALDAATEEAAMGQSDKVLAYVREHGSITAPQATEAADISTGYAGVLLGVMFREGKLARPSRGVYTLPGAPAPAAATEEAKPAKKPRNALVQLPRGKASKAKPKRAQKRKPCRKPKASEALVVESLRAPSPKQLAADLRKLRAHYARGVELIDAFLPFLDEPSDARSAA